MESELIIKCPDCGANNRVAARKSDTKAVCGRCKRELPEVPDKPLTITDRNFSEIVENSALPVLLDLWAPWCPPCRQLAPIIEGLAGELGGRVLVGKLDVDENPRTAARFYVQSIPTLLILKNGHEADRIVGLASRETILSRLEPLRRG
ncbi:MAG: thioredoxin [Acidobacteria bacterium]|nr:thioredoxin [Acidobacteriota bacterium]